MRLTFVVILISFSANLYSQIGRLWLYHYVQIEQDFVEFNLKIYKSGDTQPLRIKTLTDSTNRYIDSLPPGNYLLEITGAKETNLRSRFTIREDEITVLNIDLSLYEEPSGLDTARRVTKRADGELNLGYMDYKVFDPSGVFTKYYMVGTGIHYWNAFRPHLGFLYGCGFNYRYTGVMKDTSFLETPSSYRKKWEGYNYLDFHGDVKLRLSSRHQQVRGNPSGLLLELGAIYNFPLYFRYTGRYEGNKRLTVQGIHQFTDLRVFINFGYTSLIFFCEYRLNDFVIGHYPEFPRYTFGIRIFSRKALINDRST